MDKYTAPYMATRHNNLFVQVLSRKDKAIAFFKKYLPKRILKLADLNQLELVESKHMSDAGFSLYNDILYRCPLGKDQVGYFFLMAEHQATPDDRMPIRLMKYNIATIEGHLKQKHKQYPIVVNSVFYTGKTPWPYSTAFSDHYADPELGKQFLYMAPYNLVLVPKDKQEAIYIDPDLGFCFAAYYCSRTSDAYQAFANFKEIPIFREYFDKLPADERNLLGRYIGLCVDRSRYSLEKVVNLFTINEQEKEAFMRSVAHEYIAQGIEQGIAQGIEKGIEQGIGQGIGQGIKTRNIEIARSMIKEGFDVNVIMKITNLNKEAIETLKNNQL